MAANPAWLRRLLNATHRALDQTAAHANEPLLEYVREDLIELARTLEAELEAAENGRADHAA